MATFNFELSTLPPRRRRCATRSAPSSSRSWPSSGPRTRARSWGGFNRDFSRRMGERGWIGMTWPKKYGGHERTRARALRGARGDAGGGRAGGRALGRRPPERPAAAALRHRGAAPALPAANRRGEVLFAHRHERAGLGLRPRLRPHARPRRWTGGYKVNGTKIWTSNAHLSDYTIAARSAPSGCRRRGTRGSPSSSWISSRRGISIRPIIDLAGGHHFNEVLFQDCLVPDDMLVGKDGEGWKQVTTELAFERSGPERYLSSLQLVIELIREAGQEPAERARRADRPAHRAPGDAAPDVALDRHHAAGRAEPEPGGRGREGHRHHLRAGDPGGGPRAHRRRAAHRQRRPSSRRRSATWSSTRRRSR